MSSSVTCANCNALVPKGSPMGLCPRCCLFALDDEDDFVVPEPDPNLDSRLEIPGFELISQLGSGAFGEVYECLEFEPAVRRVAVKVLKAESMGAAQRLKEEIQILAALEHPSIARLFSAGELKDRRPYYAMELVDGRNFLHWIQEVQPSIEDRVEVLIQISGALAHAHSRGVIHRDLKPGNVLVMREGTGWRAKVIDFGVARAIHGVASFGREVTLADTWVGTPYYMSPEQIAGSQKVGPAADVYGMGLLIFEAIYEAPVMGGMIDDKGSWLEIYETRKQWRPSPWPEHVPARVRAYKDVKLLYWVGVKATAWDEGRRYPDGDALHRELLRLRQGEALQAKANNKFYLLRRKLAKSKGALFILLSGILVVFGFMIGGPLFFDYSQEVVFSSPSFDRQGSDRLLMEAQFLINEGRTDEAEKRLHQAIAKWPHNESAQLSLAVLKSLSPKAQQLPDVTLPQRAEQIWKMKDGRWGVVLEDGRVVAVAESGEIEELKVPLPEARDYWFGRTPISWVARKSAGGRLDFSSKDASYPVLQSLRYSEAMASVTLNSGTMQVASVDGSRILKRWDFSSLGRNRSKIQVEGQLRHLGFGAEGGVLWLDTDQGQVVRWPMTGEPEPHGQAFESLGPWRNFQEAHVCPLDLSLLPAELLVKLTSREKNEVVCAARARSAEDIVLASKDGLLSHWRPGQKVRELKVGMHHPDQLNVSADGKLAVLLKECGWVLMVDLESMTEIHNFRFGDTVTSISILDGNQKVIVGTGMGEVTMIDVATGACDSKATDLLKGRLGPARTMVYALPGGQSFMAAIHGELEIHRFDIKDLSQPACSLPHDFGVSCFFLSSDGHYLLSVDQLDDPKSKRLSRAMVKIWSMRTGKQVTQPFQHRSRIVGVNFSPDSRVLVTATADGEVRRWTFASMAGAVKK